MDDQRFGMALRAARSRRGWTQVEVARRAGVGRTTVSRLERGLLDASRVGVVRRVSKALEIYVALVARSRGGEVDRLADRDHAALAEAFVRWLVALGWEVRPEVAFFYRGERGIVDLVAWHAPTRSLLLIELKTRIVEVGRLLMVLEQRHRLGREIAASLGWMPATVSSVLVLLETVSNHRRLAEHRELFRASLPVDGRSVRPWLKRPGEAIRGVMFLSIDSMRNTRQEVGARRPATPSPSSVGRGATGRPKASDGV